MVDYRLRIEETAMLTVIVYICRAKPKTLFRFPIDRAKTSRPHYQNLEFSERAVFLSFFSLGRRQLQPVNITSLSGRTS